jgi:hypothetical protein
MSKKKKYCEISSKGLAGWIDTLKRKNAQLKEHIASLEQDS